MIGNAKPIPKTRSGWLSRLRQGVHQYVGIDGGAGAYLLADLAGRDPYMRQVSSPRHADLLIIVEPISQKLASAVVTLAKALVQPFHVLIVGEPKTERAAFREGNLARLEVLFPGADRVSSVSAEQVLAAAFDAQRQSDMSITDTYGEAEETTIQLPTKQDQEMATELVVLSLGPLQAFTAGPLRLFLICDGEQVLSVQMETEYAFRGIDHAMIQGDWQQGLTLARLFDPLAPLAGQLAYVQALEHLQGWQPPPQLQASRELALALERVQNTLWWLVRFARLLDDAPLTERSYHCARDLAEVGSYLWQTAPMAWMIPQYVDMSMIRSTDSSVIARLRKIARTIDVLCQYVGRNRGLALRTRNIGVITHDILRDKGIVSGPVYAASEHGSGDVQSRLTTRLQTTLGDIQHVVETTTTPRTTNSPQSHPPHWDVPAGEARVMVKGPRGDIGLYLVSKSGEGSRGPALVEWQRPSASLLAFLPDVLVGQKLADAEVILASLDLSMAEVDG